LWGWYPWFTDVLNEILLCVMWSCELWLSVTPFPSSMCLVCMECPSCSSFWLTVIFSFSVVSLTPYSHFLPCDSSHSRDDWVDLCPVNTRIVNNSNSECGILNSSNSVRVTASSLYRNDFTVMITRRILRSLLRVWRRNLYFSILTWTTKYIYYYIACMNLEDELLHMHAHDQTDGVNRKGSKGISGWCGVRRFKDNSLVGFVLIAKDKWMTWRKEV
jgi:hypothetical protein